MSGTSLTTEQQQRFQRHLLVPEIGEEGQRKLLCSSVLVVGCGGLGSASLFYLTAAGVGKIGAVDSDVVDLSNLQRQILHGVDTLGQKKVASACSSLRRLFPEVQIESCGEYLDSRNVLDMFKKYDLIIDGSDNLPTRYVMNRAAIETGKPIIFGAVKEFYGQMTTVIPGKTPCYECLFPEQPAEAYKTSGPPGVVSMTPGVIGTLQATEAVKLLLDIGGNLAGKLLLYDGLTMQFDTVSFSKNELCPVCGENRV